MMENSVEESKEEIPLTRVDTIIVESSELNEEEENESADPPRPSSSQIGEAITCGICFGLLYKCVTVVPCMHNFCGPCMREWSNARERAPCPQCRGAATHIRSGCVARFQQRAPPRFPPPPRALDAAASGATTPCSASSRLSCARTRPASAPLRSSASSTPSPTFSTRTIRRVSARRAHYPRAHCAWHAACALCARRFPTWALRALRPCAGHGAVEARRGALPRGCTRLRACVGIPALARARAQSPLRSSDDRARARAGAGLGMAVVPAARRRGRRPASNT
jgi:hypothetical protein